MSEHPFVTFSSQFSCSIRTPTSAPPIRPCAASYSLSSRLYAAASVSLLQTLAPKKVPSSMHATLAVPTCTDASLDSTAVALCSDAVVLSACVSEVTILSFDPSVTPLSVFRSSGAGSSWTTLPGGATDSLTTGGGEATSAALVVDEVCPEGEDRLVTAAPTMHMPMP